MERSHRAPRFYPIIAFIALAALSVAVVPAFAQGDAAIIGQVTDESGAVLPGVTITATSPALQVQSVSAITNERGEYRMTPLPIGTYVVVYELSGFQTVKREGVRLTQGFAAKIDVPLKVGSLSETITVSGLSPVIDVTSAASSTQLTKEMLEAIPTGRNGVISLAQQTPGVRSNIDIGGTAMVTNPTFRAFGQSGEVWHTLDGITMTILEGGEILGSDYIDYSALDEGRIDTIAKDAEVPRPGIMIMSIVKSGSNDFHGSGFWGQTRPWLQGANVDDNLRTQQVTGQNKVVNRIDVSGEIGGRLKRDKLWFYQALRKRGIDEQLPGVLQPDGTQGIHAQKQYFTTTKLSYQPTASQRIVGFIQYQHKQDIGNNLTPLFAYETRSDQIFYDYPYKVEYQATHGNSLTTSLLYGEFPSESPWSAHSDNPATFDTFTRYTSGVQLTSGSVYKRVVHNAKGSIDWYKSNAFHGDHGIKVGGEYLDVTGGRGFVDLKPGNYRLTFNNGVPFQLVTYTRPVDDPKSVVHFTGLYVKDSWTFTRDLTLNLGARFDRSAGFAPEQCRRAGQFAEAQCYPRVELQVWNNVSPRLYASYDIRGNGKTVLKGGWGRYPHIRTTMPEVISVTANTLQTTTWKWNDTGNKLYDPGEVNLNPSGPDFVSVTGGVNFKVNPNEQQPSSDEVSASLERELMPSFAVRVTGIYSRVVKTQMIEGVQRPFSAYTIPVTRPDPGPDGRVGTVDDPGKSFTYYEYPTSLGGQANSTTQLVNPPGGTQTYRSIDIAASKRLSNRWAFMASYSATKKHIPLGAGTSTPGGQGGTMLVYNPNTIFNLGDDTWEWTAKASGTYQFPFDIVSSANYELRSGNTYGRQVLFTGGVTIPSIVLPVEPNGTHAQPNIHLLDARIEKRFPLRGAQQLVARLNIFNVINANTPTSINTQSGPTYGYALTILPPRVGEFNIVYKF